MARQQWLVSEGAMLTWSDTLFVRGLDDDYEIEADFAGTVSHDVGDRSTPPSWDVDATCLGWRWTEPEPGAPDAFGPALRDVAAGVLDDYLSDPDRWPDHLWVEPERDWDDVRDREEDDRGHD